MTTDPFATVERHPSLSFKDAPVGTTYTGTVVEAPLTVQSRDFESGEPATWPDGNKKLSVVTIVEINGEKWSLWAAKPSAMFRAISDAQQVAGAQIAVGGRLTITFSAEQPNEKNPRLNPQKLYKVTYQPNDPFGTDNGQVNITTGEVEGKPLSPGFSHPTGATSQTPTSSAHPTPKQHTPEVLAALKAAGIDPATIPVQ